MSNLTSVGITAGVPTSGTGTVSTLDQVMAQGVPISDGTATNIAAIKGASTAAVATDKALVVAVSPNNTVPVSLASVPSHAVTNAGTFAVQVTSAPSTAVTNAGTFAVQVTSAPSTAVTNAGTFAVQVSNANANGSAADASSAPVAWSTEGKASIGSLTETAPATDTASSGLNGRLQRVAQRITSLIALLPTSLGGNTAANSLPVVPADQYATHKEVAASQTAAVLGATGAIGDYLAYVVVYPGTAGCGVVTILDAASTVGTFAGGGTTALPSLAPFTIPVGAFCTGAGWKITTGANVTVSAVGKFT